MRVEVNTERDYAIVQVAGEVDMVTSPQLRSAILDYLGQEAPVLVDLREVTYIDSSGVASLVEGYQTARGKELDFALAGVSEPAMGVFQLARLDQVFPIFESPERFFESTK